MAVVCVPRPWASLLTALEKIAAGGEAMKTFWGLELKNHYYFFPRPPLCLSNGANGERGGKGDGRRVGKRGK